MSEGKRQKMSEEDGNRVPQVKSQKSKTEFYALNDDCILHILDWLSIKELATIKITCKRLYLLANEHFRNTYKHNSVRLVERSKKPDITVSENDLKSFKFHMPIIESHRAGIETFKLIGEKMNKNVKYMCFIWLNYDQNKINAEHCEYAKDVLQNIEAVEFLVSSSINCLLRYCTKLEYLILNGYSIRSEELSHTYPTLKQLKWNSRNFRNCFPVELKDFLVRNPNIRAFYANNDDAITTTNWLLETGIKLDDLVLEISMMEKDINMDKIIENMHSLHKNRQIKTLHLDISHKNFFFHPKLPEIDFVESVRFDGVGCEITPCDDIISRMPNLKFLIYYNEYRYVGKFELLAQKLTNLEEFHTDSIISIDEIIPFVGHTPKLKIIYLKYRENSCHWLGVIKTTLQSLDKERRKLKNACKLTIYMHEKLYLQMKCNSSTNSYGLVEIKRTDSYPFSKHPMRPNISY